MSLHLASRIAWCVIGAVAVFMVFNMFYPQYKEYQQLQETVQALQLEYDLQLERIKLLKDYQERLEDDPEFVKKIAQEEIGLVSTGETVIKFEKDQRAGIANP